MDYTAPIKRLHLMGITMRHFVYIKYIRGVKQDFYYIILILEYMSDKNVRERKNAYACERQKAISGTNEFRLLPIHILVVMIA